MSIFNYEHTFAVTPYSHNWLLVSIPPHGVDIISQQSCAHSEFLTYMFHPQVIENPAKHQRNSGYLRSRMYFVTYYPYWMVVIYTGTFAVTVDHIIWYMILMVMIMIMMMIKKIYIYILPWVTWSNTYWSLILLL